MQAIEQVSLAEIRRAHERIADLALRTPLVELQALCSPQEFRDAARVFGTLMSSAAPGRDSPGVEATSIHLKLENLQPIGSFKLRGAGNAMRKASRESLSRGAWTPSAGNMAQGVAWTARTLGVTACVVVPDNAPHTKVQAVERLGARIVRVPYDVWWRALQTHTFEGVEGVLVHPVCDADVIAGNGTIGLEILEDLADVDTLLVPYGGGGLSVGVASAIRALRPATRIYACEVETAAPLAASFAAGAPQPIQHVPSFVDGIGARCVLDEMWPAARHLLDGALVVSLAEVAAAIRHLAEHNHVIAEGAGAAPVAAALAGRAPGGTIACVVSGGNIDASKLRTILAGKLPD